MKVDLFLAYHIPENYVLEAVEGALGQDYENFHLHVVDDATGSDFNQTIAGSFPNRLSKISFYKNPQRIGFYASLNKCFSHFRGEMFFICDSDDVSMPWRVSDAVEVYRGQDFDVYSACARWIKHDGTPADSYCLFEKITFDENHKMKGRFFHPTMAVKNSFFKDINGYSGFFVGGDRDFVAKSYFYGAKFHYDRRIAILRRSHLNQVTKTDDFGMKSNRRELIHKRIDWRIKNIYSTRSRDKIRQVGRLTSQSPALLTY